MSTFAQYKSTFRNYAIQHKSIGHIAASELPDYDTNDDCHFALFSSDEVITKLRTTVSSGVVLLLHPYSFSGGRNDADSTHHSLHECSFIICTKADATNFEEQSAALDHTETITWDIIRRIYQDANGMGQTCNFFSKIQLESFHSDTVHNIFDGRYGWLTKFNFTVKRTAFMDTTYEDNDPNNPFNIPAIQQPG